MKIKEAKDNVMKNFRANYTNDHMFRHDVEVFLLNTLEQIVEVVKKEAIEVAESYNNHSSHAPEDKCIERIMREIGKL